MGCPPYSFNRQIESSDNQIAILFSEEGPVSIFKPGLSFAGNVINTDVPPASLGSTLILPSIARIFYIKCYCLIAVGASDFNKP